MSEFLRELGESFPPETYLVLTRIEGVLWTLADYIIVYYLLKISDLCRSVIGRRPHRGAYYTLAATVPVALLLPVAPSGQAFFRLELLVTIPHFLLILYVCLGDASTVASALAKRLSHAGIMPRS